MKARKRQIFFAELRQCLFLVLSVCAAVILIMFLIGCGEGNPAPTQPMAADPDTDLTIWSAAEVTDDFSLYANSDEGAVYLLSRDGDLTDFSVRIGVPLRDIYQYGFPERVESFVEVSDLSESSGFGESVAFGWLGDTGCLFLFVGVPNAYEGGGAVFTFMYHSRAGWIEVESARILGKNQMGRFIAIDPVSDGIVVDGEFFSFSDFLFTEIGKREMEEKN